MAGDPSCLSHHLATHPSPCLHQRPPTSAIYHHLLQTICHDRPLEWQSHHHHEKAKCVPGSLWTISPFLIYINDIASPSNCPLGLSGIKVCGFGRLIRRSWVRVPGPGKRLLTCFPFRKKKRKKRRATRKITGKKDA